MLARSIVAAIIRILAIVLVFRSLSTLFTHQITGTPAPIWGAVFAVGISVLISTLLWAKSFQLSGWLLPSAAAQEPAEPLTTAAVESIALSLLAVYLLWQGITGLFYWANFYFFATSKGVSLSGFHPEQWAGFITSIFEFVLGIAIVVGIKQIIKWLRWLRTAGLSKVG